ncbi:MAG: diaminopimelate epimerase [Paludibacteraceae bacterium]
MSQLIHFTKMHGLGNDYIYVNNSQYPIANPERAAIEWSRPHTGIGADGLVLIDKSLAADFRMRIFNADGSEAMMCGNASRCIGKFVYDNRLTDKTEISLETLSGIKNLSLETVDGVVKNVTVDMGTPLLQNKEQVNTADGMLHEQHFDINGASAIGTFVCMGNPHLVLFVEDVETLPIEQIGKELERHPLFPQRINVEFAEIRSSDTIRMRVWERGSGITQACGTGACATAVAAILSEQTNRKVNICMDGGTLQIEWNATDGKIYMSGPAVTVFEGDIILNF